MNISALLVLALLTLLPALAPSARAQPVITTRTVEYTVDGRTMKGFLAYDETVTAKRPGVLVIPEWWGLNDYARARARQLAELGYVAFAADMYGDGKVVETPAEAQALATPFYQNAALFRSRAGAGLKVLSADPNVDPARLAAVGYCFGGSTVLELAYSGADVRGVVSFHGGLRAPSPEDYPGIKAKFLVCHGADDTFISAEDMQAFEAGMRAAHCDWQLISYGNSVHAFTNPKADDRHMQGVAYNQKADQRSWTHMRDFLSEIFAE